jgi:hypothetical protein
MPARPPLVSVIVPALTGDGLHSRELRRDLAETDANLEAILVDDRWTDVNGGVGKPTSPGQR